MHSKKVISAVMAIGLLASTMVNSQALSKNNMGISKPSLEQSINYNNGGASDVSVANEEKINEMLKKEGKIPEKAKSEESNKIFNEYIKKTSKQNKDEKLTKQQKEFKAKEAKNKNNKNIKQKSSDEVTEVNMLVLLA